MKVKEFITKLQAIKNNDMELYFYIEKTCQLIPANEVEVDDTLDDRIDININIDNNEDM